MFDIELMKFNPQAPSFLAMLITALFAFMLSSGIAVTYQLTTKSIYRRAHFLQSLVLIGIVAATILQAIGESVAIGLGIIGALSIIRFRTAMNDPRNITFMFASLGSGLACGVMGFGIAITGTLVFCAGAFALRFSPLNDDNEMIGTLRLRVPRADKFQNIIEQRLKIFCSGFELNRHRFINSKKVDSLPEGETEETAETSKGRMQEFVYQIQLKRSTTLAALEGNMTSINGLKNLQLDFQKQATKL